MTYSGLRFHAMCVTKRDEIDKGSVLLEYIKTGKCNRHVYETNDRNKIKHFQKGYSRQLRLYLTNLALLAQSTGAEEYINCISVEGYIPPKSVSDMTKLAN